MLEERYMVKIKEKWDDVTIFRMTSQLPTIAMLSKCKTFKN